MTEIDKQIMVQVFFGSVSMMLPIIVALAAYTWRKHTQAVDRQNELLSNIDKNLAIACHTIEMHSAQLEEGKKVHKELRDQGADHEKRISVIEAKIGFK